MLCCCAPDLGVHSRPPNRSREAPLRSPLSHLSATSMAACAAGFVLLSCTGWAQVVPSPGPQIGSPNTISADAQLQFYPVSSSDPAPRVADVVVPLPNTPGGAATLNTTTSQLAQPVTLPLNTEAAYLDVFAQSQGGDEFWYTCVPN